MGTWFSTHKAMIAAVIGIVWALNKGLHLVPLTPEVEQALITLLASLGLWGLSKDIKQNTLAAANPGTVAGATTTKDIQERLATARKDAGG